jgi:hypothetical protein
VLTYTCRGGEKVEGKDCWVFRVDYSRKYKGRYSTATIWYDKQLGPLAASPVKVEYQGSFKGLPCTFSFVNSVKFSGDKPFPMEEEKEFKVSTTSAFTRTELEKTISGQGTDDSIYRVEGKEDVSTFSGDIDCFRIVRRQAGSNNPIYIEYYSPEIKNIVKAVDPKTGEKQWLRQYSFNQ